MAHRAARRRGVGACLAEAASEGPSLRVLARGALLAGPVVLGAERVGPRPVGARQAPGAYTRPVAPEVASLTVLGRVVAARGHGGSPAGAPRADLKPRAVAVRVDRAVGARGLVDGAGRVAVFARGAAEAACLPHIGLVAARLARRTLRRRVRVRVAASRAARALASVRRLVVTRRAAGAADSSRVVIHLYAQIQALRKGAAHFGVV